MALKAMISSPLEAGTSILDAHRLPPHLAPALEYTSRRLARKGLHITLVVARREYQLPGCVPGDDATTTSKANHPASNMPTPPISPASPDVVPCVPAFRSLVRSGTDPNPGLADKPNMRPPQRSKTTSLTKKASLASLFDGGLSSPRLRWPLTPKTPSAVPQTPRTPATPATPASSVTTASSVATSSAEGVPDVPPSSIRLIHTAPLAPRADRLVASTLARATRKFSLSASLNARDAAAYNIYPEVLHHSILQNEVLFSSEGLTLLSLDHLYTFKSALVHYTAYKSKPGSHFRLEDAVDELRRYILSSAGRRRNLLKSLLLEMYEWLGPVDETAFRDVIRMYSRAYGDLTEDTGVEASLCRVAARALEEEVIREVAPTPPPKSPPPKSQKRVARVIASPVSTLPRSAGSQTLSPQNWEVEDFSPMPDEGMVSVPETPLIKDDPLTNVEEQSSPKEAGQVDSDKTPTAPKAALITAPEAKDQQEQEEAAVPRGPPASPSGNLPKLAGKPPTPKASPKASLPTLKIQTSFQKPKPPPKRKTTPMPQRVSPREKSPESKAATPPQQDNGDDIQIVLRADDDGDDTDFEDADLTARPPPSAVDGRPGGAFWLGGSSIDQMVLGDRQQQRGSQGAASTFRHHRRSSSFAGLSPQQCEGPMTPNGYEDISPITRGEWGFLMVSDPFKTKTAAVETF